MATDTYLAFLDGVPLDMRAGLVEAQGRTKLASQWFKALLTEIGTDPHDPTYGSVFARLIGGNVSSIDDVADVVALGVSQVNAWFFANQASSDVEPSERLLTAEVLGVAPDASQDGVAIVIAITNVEGQIVPLRIDV